MCIRDRRKYPGGPRRKYHYFDVDTLEHIIPKREVLYEMMSGIEAWEENWNNQADEETNVAILEAIEEKEA